MNKNVLLTTSLLLAAGCGAQTSGRPNQPITSTSTPTPSTSASDTPTPTPAPTFPAGVYVAVHEGDDSNTGDALHPLKTVDAAIQRAIAAETLDVWIIGGGPDEHVPEIVVDRDRVNLHGSVCFPTTPSVFHQDPQGCRTTLDAGSPALVVMSPEPVTIDDLFVHGTFDPTRPVTGFTLDAMRCIAATNVALPSVETPCDRELDADGRPLPRPRIGVFVAREAMVTFRNVNVVVDNGDDGMAGTDGLPGENGGNGNGPFPGSNSACPSANGGLGGRGGFFDDSGNMVAALPGQQAASSAVASSPATFEWNVARGADGESLTWSDVPAFATDGSAGTATLDPMELVAGSGLRGATGEPGTGGGGGAGGAAANRFVYSYGSNYQYVLSKISGSVPTVIHTGTISLRAVAVTTGLGEQNGGNGGGGGAGSCGGYGGQGGQGGAASIAMLVLDGASVQTTQHTALVAGEAGRGGRGGSAGQPGIPGAAGAASVGGHVDGTAAGTLNSDGTWTPTQPQGIYLNGLPDIYSPSTGGAGGAGSDGHYGQVGGKGGDGASGMSDAIVTVHGGSVTDDGSGYLDSFDAKTLSL